MKKMKKMKRMKKMMKNKNLKKKKRVMRRIKEFMINFLICSKKNKPKIIIKYFELNNKIY